MTQYLKIYIAALALAGIAGAIGYQLGSTPAEPKPQPTGGPPLIGIASVNEGTYVKAIVASGGIPIILPDAGGGAPVEHYLELLDGLLLPGGDDIPASEFDEEPHETLTLIPDDRLKFERALSRAWIERTDKPLLGICLGCQWLSVSSGGSLVQDIPSEFGITHRVESHQVILEPDSQLAGIFGETKFAVNSMHHQAIDAPGNMLRIVARCPDGVVEAVESTDPERFIVGVQWHPEVLMPDDKRQAKLMEAFVSAAAKSKLKSATQQ
ncbi:MAG: gamma-glutamyl-gamma-aminobutyrate hydrolase family protein [Verrucomicrobiae bacterium]|nr:gamma-glutamyl-gamma-aminobutyrate hydrolase family protein [Verrucomicrobiae bacterium]